MNWSELLKFLAAFSTLFAAIGGLIAFLIKSIFKSYLDKDVEEFKAKLQVSINQNQIQFSTLHLERAQVIKDIYYKIVEAERLMKSFLFTRHGDANSTPRIQAFGKLDELAQLIERTKLFFDDRTSKLLDELIRAFRKIDLDKNLVLQR